MSINSIAVTRCKKQRKLDFVMLFGGQCSICGYNRCPDALEFHHINPKSKLMNPSRAIYRLDYDSALGELKKCILLCSNCHKELHHKFIVVPDNIVKIVWFDKICESCNNVFSTTKLDQKFCNQRCSNNRTNLHRPTKSELESLIANHTWTDLGKIFGVSDNAVRKWAKKFNITKPVGR